MYGATGIDNGSSTRSNRKVLVLPGDGIGPEIMREVMRVIEFFDRRHIAQLRGQRGSGRRRGLRCRRACR